MGATPTGCALSTASGRSCTGFPIPSPSGSIISDFCWESIAESVLAYSANKSIDNDEKFIVHEEADDAPLTASLLDTIGREVTPQFVVVAFKFILFYFQHSLSQKLGADSGHSIDEHGHQVDAGAHRQF